MARERSIPGSTHIANDVLADLAGYAALESYGVVGMASPSLRDGVAQLLSRDKLRRGIKIKGTDNGGVDVDLYVVIEYGTRISEVAHNVMESVTFRVEQSLGMPVAEVNVHVQGLRVSGET